MSNIMWEKNSIQVDLNQRPKDISTVLHFTNWAIEVSSSREFL